ncbi:hypothetical protein CNECB9_2540078 [Cupriavidus necator]|uniref:Uncharacterized protein n=1 Tax=Cupriavidus necator TaxID=106590 RepID=A0A1K0IFY6_CUPNE|nr:hypothetical protein CNECB9_2540078 [Cupriavidus necator]
MADQVWARRAKRTEAAQPLVTYTPSYSYPRVLQGSYFSTSCFRIYIVGGKLPRIPRTGRYRSGRAKSRPTALR